LLRDSVSLLDRTLRVDLPQGPCWYRYTGDGYGEHADGAPYDGTGLGHPWPLLTGERGHYELARGADAMPYLRAMAAMADGAGMLPEQVWENAPLAERGLRRGGPTGSAMPLAWAHAEFVKLACSIVRGHPVDRPEPLWARYHKAPAAAQVWFWSPQAPLRSLPAGHALALLLPTAGTVRWQFDSGAVGQVATADPGLGVHVARLPALPGDCRSIMFWLPGDGDAAPLTVVFGA
jgi:glucoamylase